MKPRRWHLLVGGLLIVAAVLLGTRLRGDSTPTTGPDRQWSQLPRRVTVEVLNAGHVAGAARVATARLRHGRLDVVSFRNAGPTDRDSALVRPLVLVRRGDTLGVGRIEAVLGPIEVRSAPDPRPLVDLSVLVGSDTSAKQD